MCINVFVDGEYYAENIFQVYYKVFALGLIFFFSSETQKKILFDDMFENVSVSFTIKTVWIPIPVWMIVSGIDLKFTFYPKIFLSLQ